MIHNTPKSLLSPSGREFYYIGPDISEGALPAFFYFALAGDESLVLDPYNQPIASIKDKPIRLFSCTLPGHEPGYNKSHPLFTWAEKLCNGDDVITPLIDDVSVMIDYLLEQKITLPGKIGCGGLSRGTLIALLIAANNAQVSHIVGFAPLTSLVDMEEFSPHLERPLVKKLDLSSYLDVLATKTIRFYIGNRDTRVGTDHAFQLVHNLANKAYEQRIRSPQIELIISPSIGYQGHGTSKENFYAGGEWIYNKLSAKETIS